MTEETSLDVRPIFLRKEVDESEAASIIEQKKMAPFKSLLSRPKKSDIYVHSMELHYECTLVVSGKYTADFFRDAVHTISVDSNVSEVVLGKDVTFLTRSRSVIKKAFVGERGKNKIDLKLEEHVFVEDEDRLTFDYHGRKIQFPFEISSKTTEPATKKLMEKYKSNIQRPEITYDVLVEELESKLKNPDNFDNIRIVNEEFILDEIIEAYVPIFEARVIGPKNKAAIIRLDAVRKKIL